MNVFSSPFARPLRGTLYVAGLAAALLACSLISLPSFGNADPACTDVQLARDSASPGDTLEVTGVPESMTGLFVQVSAADGGEAKPSPMLLTPSGGVAVLVPMHPNGLSGGELDLVITNGEHDCPQVTVQVEPIEPAPGTLDSYVTAVGDHLATWRAEADVTRDELLTGYLEAELLPLAAAQILYDGPDNPTSLVRIAQGTAEFDSGDSIDPEVLNAFLHQSGLLGGLEGMHLPTDAAATSLGRGGLTAPFLQQAAAGQLSEDMTRQHNCMGMITGASGDVVNDADLAITAVGVFNAPAGIALSAAKLVALWPVEYCAYRLPSQFTSMDVDRSHEEFNEDFDFDSEFPIVRAVHVTAQSEAWNLTPIVIDTLLLFGGAADSAAQATKVAKDPGFVNQANDALAPTVNNLCARSDCADAVGATLPPVQFGSVDINWPEYVRFTGLRSITTGEFGLYRPASTGPGGLRVETRPVFGDARSAKAIEMNVAAIEVALSPSSVVLEPGQSRQFSLNISNADNPQLNQWTESSPRGERLVAQDSDSYTFTAPAKITNDQDPDPCIKQEIWGLLVESTSRTGLRKDGEPPRSATAVITVREDVSAENPEECGTPTPTPTPEPDECLHGTWAVDPGSYNRYLEQLLSGGEITSSNAEGVLNLEFTPDWTVTINLNMNLTFCTVAGCITSNIQQTGSDTYSTNSIDGDSGRISTSGGVPIVASLGDYSRQVEGDPGSATYTCEGDTLTIIAAGAPPLQYNRTGN